MVPYVTPGTLRYVSMIICTPHTPSLPFYLVENGVRNYVESSKNSLVFQSDVGKNFHTCSLSLTTFDQLSSLLNGIVDFVPITIDSMGWHIINHAVQLCVSLHIGIRMHVKSTMIPLFKSLYVHVFLRYCLFSKFSRKQIFGQSADELRFPLNLAGNIINVLFCLSMYICHPRTLLIYIVNYEHLSSLTIMYPHVYTLGIGQNQPFNQPSS